MQRGVKGGALGADAAAFAGGIGAGATSGFTAGAFRSILTRVSDLGRGGAAGFGASATGAKDGTSAAGFGAGLATIGAGSDAFAPDVADFAAEAKGGLTQGVDALGSGFAPRFFVSDGAAAGSRLAVELETLSVARLPLGAFASFVGSAAACAPLGAAGAFTVVSGEADFVAGPGARRRLGVGAFASMISRFLTSCRRVRPRTQPVFDILGE